MIRNNDSQVMKFFQKLIKRSIGNLKSDPYYLSFHFQNQRNCNYFNYNEIVNFSYKTFFQNNYKLNLKIDEQNKNENQILNSIMDQNIELFSEKLKFNLKEASKDSKILKFISRQQIFIDTLLTVIETQNSSVTNFLYPTRDEKIKYMYILKITMPEMNDIMKQFRLVWRLKQKDKQFKDRNELFQRVKQFCDKHLINQSFQPLIQNIHFQNLIKETGESPQKIRKMINYLREKRGIVTKSKIDTLRKYIHDRGSNWNQNDVLLLSNKLKLSRQQIRQQRSMILDPNGELSDWKKEIIKKTVLQSSNKSIRIKDLQMETQLSYLQVRNLITYYKSTMKLSDDVKKKLMEYIDLNQDENTMNQYIQNLSIEHSIPISKLKQYVRYHLMKSGELTNEKKIQLVNWFKNHEFEKPTNLELISLSQRLNLHPFQIRSFLRRILL